MDISGLIPEARQPADAAALVYLVHTRPWFVGLVAHGSAVKGGLIPGSSDIDLQLYLDDSAFSDKGRLRFEVGLSIQRGLSVIDPSPSRYIQCFALSSEGPEGWTDPIPGAHCIVSSELPFAEATAEQLKRDAKRALGQLDPLPEFTSYGLLEHGGERLEHNVRLLCTKIWPTLYHVLILQGHDPIQVWNLTKQRAMGLLPEQELPGRTIREFLRAVLYYYPVETSVEEALAVVERGLSFLEAVKSRSDARLSIES